MAVIRFAVASTTLAAPVSTVLVTAAEASPSAAAAFNALLLSFVSFCTTVAKMLEWIVMRSALTFAALTFPVITPAS